MEVSKTYLIKGTVWIDGVTEDGERCQMKVEKYFPLYHTTSDRWFYEGNEISFEFAKILLTSQKA